MKKIFFVTTPMENDGDFKFCEVLEKNEEFLVAHPAFDFKSAYGKLWIESTEQQEVDFETLSYYQQDRLLVIKSDVILFDLDTKVSLYPYAVLAHESGKPIYGVSHYLSGPLPYYAELFKAILPKNLDEIRKFI
jgi:hypothetical protein